jgi:hypothetical protein
MEASENSPIFANSAQHDLDDELTRLEYAASQGQLSQQEQQRLNSLRQQRGELARDVADRVEDPHPGNPVINGDDSP